MEQKSLASRYSTTSFSTEWLRAAVIGLIAACLFFSVWALWQFPDYARQLPPGILPNANWTTATAQAALNNLGWTAETYMQWRLALILLRAVFYIGLGLLILQRRSKDPFALLFALSLVLFGTVSADLPFVLEQWGAWGARFAYALTALSFGLLIFLVFLFPDGHYIPRQMRWIGTVAIGLIFYATFLHPQYTRPPATILSILSTILLLVGVIGQIYRYRLAETAEQRQQTKWVVWAVAINLGFKLLLTVVYLNPTVNALDGQGMLYSMLRTVALTLVTAIIPVAVGFAILRYRLWDIDILIRRTIVYSIMTATVITAYVFVVGYLGFLFQTEHLLFPLVATGLVAVLFAPFKNYVEQGINKLFYGQRDEPYHLLTRLGQQLETALDSESALQQVAEIVARALKLPYVAIALRQGEGIEMAAVFGAPQNKITPIPLVYAGQTIGDLLIAARKPQEPFTPADVRLFSELASQIGAVAHTVLLTANLEQARLRLVTERGEARRQLGSDLHDGVGHRLVGLSRQLERATAILLDDPIRAKNQLQEMNQQLTILTSQVRTLAHQLFPPELELLGLIGALRERVETQSNLLMYLQNPEHLPPLPAEVETAVYFITLEALTNVEKHANARTCHIRLNLKPKTSSLHPLLLELSITDDGGGLPSNTHGGLGLLSMQARAAEVGGVCEIKSNETGGTAVTVYIPCAFKVE